MKVCRYSVSSRSKVWHLLIFALSLCHAPAFALTNEGLDETQSDIERRYQAVDHITAEELTGLSRDEVVLFDVRAEEEFAISRIEGAARVSPKISSREFLRQHGAKTNGRIVVFYCSVGHRSSRLANRVQQKLLEHGTIRVANLEGGLFEWHNLGHPMVNDEGPTNKVHPYNRNWGKLLNDQVGD